VSSINQLSGFGWTEALHQKWQQLALPDMQPARVVADFGTSLKIAAPQLMSAGLSGKLAHYSHRADAPKVGDWVAVHVSGNGHAVIEAVVPRKSEIARKVAGKRTVKQVIAANVDIAFVLLALDNDFSVERLKRFLYQLSINNIQPVIVLNKADKVDDISPYMAVLKVFDLPIIICQAINGIGVKEVIDLIHVGQTAILLGSSGVGKSTLTNQLLGRDVQKTQEIRESDATGKHTTVHRELFVLSGGGLLIDTPGIRELQLWGTQEDLDENFDDVAALARQCRFASCRHAAEPGCAVQAALKDGRLDPAHFASYQKMKIELAALEKKNAVKERQSNIKSYKKRTKQVKEITRDSWKEMDE
jgi:ribosome biogenesis GTPase / thiamine phosphate phosphatase